MTDLVNRMSINYYIEQKNKGKRNEIEKLNNRRDIDNKSNVLTDEMINVLGHLGFSIQQIWNAFKEYKFSKIEDAVYLMIKDPETNKYHHKFHKIEINENSDFLNSKEAFLQNVCGICGEGELEHLENKLDIENIPETNLNVNQIKLVELSPQTISDLEDDTLCRICYSNKLDPMNEKEKIKCGHTFCALCIQNHITTRIINGKVNEIKCLSAGCSKIFTKEEIRSSVNQNIYFKYMKFLNNQMKYDNSNNRDTMIIYCPHPDCEEVQEIEFNSRTINYECEIGHKFCIKCKNEVWHESDKCTTSEELMLKEFKNNNCSLNIQLCPHCNILIEKVDGCNHMKCINCNYEFCWLCLKEYESIHYALYNFRGCPGMRFYTKKKEKCYDNSFMKFLWYLLSFLMGFIIVCLILLFFFFCGCPYEFIKCYLEKKCFKEDEEEDEESQISEEYNQVSGNKRNQNSENNNGNEDNPDDNCKFSTISICILIGIVGIFLQPFYLFFYFLYGMMECYRRFNCWYFYL